MGSRVRVPPGSPETTAKTEAYRDRADRAPSRGDLCPSNVRRDSKAQGRVFEGGSYQGGAGAARITRQRASLGRLREINSPGRPKRRGGRARHSGSEGPRLTRRAPGEEPRAVGVVTAPAD